jgi:hypothetical protein
MLVVNVVPAPTAEELEPEVEEAAEGEEGEEGEEGAEAGTSEEAPAEASDE